MFHLARIVAVPLVAGFLLAGCGGQASGQEGVAAPRVSPSSAAPTPTGTPAPSVPVPSVPVPSVPAPSVPASSATPSAKVPKELKFQARTLDGAAFSGATLLGKPTVMWFWAPWCSVCRSEAPGLAEVARQFAGKVAFVGVAGRDGIPEMKSFVGQQRLGFFPHLVDADGELWASFGVLAQPAYAFLTRDGKLEVVPSSLSRDELIARTTALAG